MSAIFFNVSSAFQDLYPICLYPSENRENNSSLEEVSDVDCVPSKGGKALSCPPSIAQRSYRTRLVLGNDKLIEQTISSVFHLSRAVPDRRRRGCWTNQYGSLKFK